MLLVQITICSDHAEFPDLKLTTFGTKPIFERLRAVRRRRTSPLLALPNPHVARSEHQPQDVMKTGSCVRLLHASALLA